MNQPSASPVSMMPAESLDGEIHEGEKTALMSFDRRTLGAKVRGYLEEQIVRNRLAPGTPLTEVEIAQHLGVSRAPVREALLALQGDGLVQVVPRRGAVVSPLSAEDVRDTYEARAALESLVTRHAVERMRPEDISELDACLADMTDALAQSDVTRYSTINLAFHQIFLERCESNILQTLYATVSKHSLRFRYRYLSLPSSLQESLEYHRQIVAAAKIHDGAGAADLAESHIRASGRALLATLTRGG